MGLVALQPLWYLLRWLSNKMGCLPWIGSRSFPSFSLFVWLLLQPHGSRQLKADRGGFSCLTAGGSGNTITYAELHVKPQPQGNSRAETSAPGCQHRCSAWFYVALVLAVLVLILLAVVAIQARQFSKARAGKSESLPQHGLNNTSSDISSERTISAAFQKWLMEELCEDGQGTTCELCPPGWQLHRGRCYFFSEEARSWEDSQKNCLARKSQLLVIEDEIEMEFIDNKDKDTKYIWIGLDSEDMEKTWSSVGDHRVKEMSRTVLKSIKADKNCAVYRRKNVIQADNCQTLKEWICKKNATLLVL